MSDQMRGVSSGRGRRVRKVLGGGGGGGGWKRVREEKRAGWE